MTIASLIVNVQANHAELIQSVSKVNTSLDTVGSTASKLGQRLASMFTITAIAGAIKSYADFTSTINDLSLKTGIGVEALQRMKFAAEQNGSTLEQVTTAVTKLGANLAGGNKSALGALDALGLSFESIRAMSPDKAFGTIADAIAKVPDPMDRSKLSLDLFGKSGAALLPMMRGNFSETAAEAQRLGIVMSGEAVAAGAKFGDTLHSLGLVGKSVIAQMLTPMIPALTSVAGGLGDLVPAAIGHARGAFDWFLRVGMQVQAWFLKFMLTMTEVAASVPGLGKALGFTATVVDEYRARVHHAEETLKIFSDTTTRTAGTQEKSIGTVGRLNLNYADNARATRAAAAANEALDPTIQRLTESLTKQIDASSKVNRTLSLPAVPEGFRLQRVELETLVPLQTKSFEATTAAHAAAEKWAQANGAVLAPSIKQVGTATEAATAQTSQFMSTLANGFAQLGQIKGGLSGGLITGIGQIISGLSTAQKVAEESGGRFGVLGVAFDKSAKGSDRLAAGVAAGVSVAQGAINVWNAAGNSATKMGGAFMGAMAGASAGAMFGPWGAAIGAVGGAIVGLFRGGAQAAKDAAALMAKQNAALIATLKGQLAGFQSDLQGLIGKGAELGYTFNAAGEMIGVKFDKMRDVAQKYGTDLASLGPAFHGSRLHDAAQTIIDDFWLLVNGGADVGAVLESMSPQINTLVNDSIKFGIDIPKNMEPWILELLRAGKLTDENGNKLTDLSGITFGEDVAAQFLTIQSAILELIAKINELVARISGIPHHTEATVRITTIHDDIYNTYDGEHGLDWGGAQAHGGDYFVTRPTLFLAGEAGPERATFSGGGTGASRGDGLADEVRRLVRDLPRAMKVAVADAMVLQGAR